VARFQLHHTDVTVSISKGCGGAGRPRLVLRTIPPACIYTLVGEPATLEDRSTAPGAPEPVRADFLVDEGERQLEGEQRCRQYTT